MMTADNQFVRSGTREMRASIEDSVRNWVISMPLDEPPIFFIPTSFALLEAWAVDRFMKLIK
jgi:hypothetical protein